MRVVALVSVLSVLCLSSCNQVTGPARVVTGTVTPAPTVGAAVACP